MTLKVDKGALAPFLLASVFTAGTTLASVMPLGSYDRQRWLLLLLLSLLAVMSIRKRTWTLSLSVGLWVGSWVAFIGLVGIGSVIAHSVGNDWALFDLMYWLLLTLGVVGLVHLFSQSSNVIPNVCKALVGAVGFYYLVVLMNYSFAIISPFDWDKMMLASPAFTNVRFLNQVQVLLFPLMLVLALQPGKRWPQLAFLCAAFTVSLVIYSRGRGAMVAITIESLLVAGLLLMYIGKPFALRYIRLWAFIVILGISVYLILFDWIPDWRYGEGAGGPLIREGTSGRWGMWLELLGSMKGHWLFGHGGFGYAEKAGNITAFFAHPHNSLLQLLFEYGLPATVLFVVFFIGLTFRALKAMHESGSVFLPFLLAAAIGGAVLSMVSGVIVMPFSQMLLVVIIAALCHSSYLEADLSIKWTTSKTFQRLSLLFVVALISVVWALSFQSYTSVMGVSTQIFDVGPRFWFIGRME